MIRSFAAEDTVRGEITVGAVTFGGGRAEVHQPFAPAWQIDWRDMNTGGRTPWGRRSTWPTRSCGTSPPSPAAPSPPR